MLNAENEDDDESNKTSGKLIPIEEEAEGM